MTHHAVTVLSQTVALILFIALFIGVLLYVFWPGNKKKFDEAANLPLEDEKSDKPGGEDRS
jgi:cytochrome c oxidase cbb3-type subunit IV